MRRKPRNAYHHGDLREALVVEAMACLAKEGVEAVTLRRIAARLGVSHAAPAHHFPTRDALLGAVAGRGYARLGGAMETSRDGAGGRRALAAIGLAYVRFALEHPDLFRLMFGGTVTGDGCDAEGRAAAERCQTILREAVAGACPPERAAPSHDGQQSNVLPEPALASWALVHGLATLWIERQVGDYFAGPRAQERFLAAVEAILD